MRMLLLTQSAGLARPGAHRPTPYCAFIHAPCTCHHDLIQVWTGGEWEWTACTCRVCTEQVAS